MPERLSDEAINEWEKRMQLPVELRGNPQLHSVLCSLFAEVREWRVHKCELPEEDYSNQVQPWVDVVTEINKFAIEQRAQAGTSKLRDRPLVGLIDDPEGRGLVSIYPEDWAKGP